MANPVHEALFRQGIPEWNHWRARNGSVTPDLSGIAFSAANLGGADLSRARLRGAMLIRSRLEGADLRYADLCRARLHEADLSDADLARANLEGAVLTGANLRRTRLTGANLRGAQVMVANLREADLRDADFESADLRESTAQKASLDRASLKNALVRGCVLAQCDLSTVTGLTSRQVAEAVLDETTILPESFDDGDATRSFKAVARALEAIKARWTEATVSETDVASYHRLLARAGSLGVSIEEAGVAEAELVRASGADPPRERWVDAALVRSKLDSVLAEVRRRTTGA